MLFVEGFKRPERFLALADHALAMGKPILAVKVGRSAQAQAAAIAHSGSLAGEDRVTDAALDAAGVIRCDDLDELLEAAELIAGAGRLGRRLRRRADGRRDGVDRGGVAGRRPRRSDRPRPAAGDRRGAGRDPARPADDGLHRQPAGPVGRGGRGDRLPGVVRGARGVGRLRRAGDRPRQPVPRPAQRGGGRHDRQPGAGRGDRGPAGAAAGLRVADLGRREREVKAFLDAAGGMPMLQRRDRGVRGDRAAGRAGRRERAERVDAGPRRPEWPALAADRRGVGRRRDARPAGAGGRGGAAAWRCPSARAWRGSPTRACP